MSIAMEQKTVTRADISEVIYKEVGLSRNESSDLLEMLLDEITVSLAKKETVKISSFGTFSVREKNLRMGRNPKTGEEVPILPRSVLSFKPSQILKDRINGKVSKG